MKQVSARIFNFCVIVCIVPVFRGLTPPRIIYGGWTPIVPGHPYYFGTVKHSEHPHYQTHHHVHYGEPPALSHLPESEHEVEHHVQYVSPQYQTYDKPKEVYQSYDKPQEVYQSYDKPQEVYQSYDKPKEVYQSYHKPEEVYQSYDKPQEVYQSYDKPKEVYQSYHKPEEVYQSYDKPQEVYQSYDKPKEVYQSYDKPKEVYHLPHQTHPPKEEHEQITYGHKPLKNIFSYYPPQSAYDAPKGHQYGYKPIYIEVPRKPLNIFQNAELTSLKDLPIDLKSIYPVSGKGSLKMKPFSLNELKHIGHINAGQLHHLVPDVKYPLIKDSSGGIPKKPTLLSYGYESPAVIHLPYGISHLPKGPVNTYKGGAIKGEEYLHLKRPLNPIETKYMRNAQFHQISIPQLSGYKNLNFPVVSPSLHSVPRYLPLAKHQGRHPSLKSHIVPGVRPYHKGASFKPAYPSLRYPSSTLPPNLLTSYLHKNVKLHSLYRNPAVVTSIRGAPAIVEREVAIIHVPVGDSKAYPLNAPNEYLYHTASTPESTQILDIARLNQSVPVTALNAHRPIHNNESFTHITLDYGKGVQHVTLLEPTVNSQIAPPVENDVDDPQQHQYIFVSSSGVRGKDLQNSVDDSGRTPNGPQDVHKQFFHAYYGPPDHVPQPGYVRMTLPEFNSMFSNAEIRFVDKELDSQSSAKKE